MSDFLAIEELERPLSPYLGYTPPPTIQHSVLKPRFTKGHFKGNIENGYEVKVKSFLELTLSDFPLSGNYVFGLFRANECENFRVEGQRAHSPHTDDEIRSKYPLRVSTDVGEGDYIADLQLNAYVVQANLDGQMKVTIQFTRISSFVTDEERASGLRPSIAKNMVLRIYLESDLSNYKAAIPVKIVSELRNARRRIASEALTNEDSMEVRTLKRRITERLDTVNDPRFLKIILATIENSN